MLVKVWLNWRNYGSVCILLALMPIFGNFYILNCVIFLWKKVSISEKAIGLVFCQLSITKPQIFSWQSCLNFKSIVTLLFFLWDRLCVAACSSWSSDKRRTKLVKFHQAKEKKFRDRQQTESLYSMNIMSHCSHHFSDTLG